MLMGWAKMENRIFLFFSFLFIFNLNSLFLSSLLSHVYNYNSRYKALFFIFLVRSAIKLTVSLTCMHVKEKGLITMNSIVDWEKLVFILTLEHMLITSSSGDSNNSRWVFNWKNIYAIYAISMTTLLALDN
jgi:predicted metallopeptidase